MNRIEREFAKKDLQITDDNKLVREQRKIGNIGRLITAARAAESEFDKEVKSLNGELRAASERLAEVTHELADAKQENADLTRELAISQQQLKKAELRAKVEGHEFTQAQRTLLLENGSPEMAAAS